MYKKSLFINKTIRNLKGNEIFYLQNLESLINEVKNFCTIGYIDKILSCDDKIRPLILSKEVLVKIQNKHGKINPVNLIINANDWDIAIKNIDRTLGKICLIKYVPQSDNILIIGAIRKNGFFILSHYEVEITQDNQLKSLLGRGDVFRKDA
jgi:hypothetical protein